MEQATKMFFIKRFIGDKFGKSHSINGKNLKPMSFAILNKNFDCLRWVLSYCAKNERRDCCMISDLCQEMEVAIDLERTSMLKLLLESRLACQPEDQYDHMNIAPAPLIRALDKGNRILARLLLEHGVDVTKVIFEEKDEEKRQFVLEHAFKYQNSSLKVVVYKAASKGDVECLSSLLQGPYASHFDLNFRVYGDTPLTIAVKMNKLAVVKELLKHNINANMATMYNEPPLQLAVQRFCGQRLCSIEDSYEIARTLVRYGCDGKIYIDCICWEDLELLKPRKLACLVKLLLYLAGTEFETLLDIRHPSMSKAAELVSSDTSNPANHLGSLKHLSRLCIRFALAPNVPEKVDALKGMIATEMIDYLLLPELDDIDGSYMMRVDCSDDELGSDAEYDDYFASMPTWQRCITNHLFS